MLDGKKRQSAKLVHHLSETKDLNFEIKKLQELQSLFQDYNQDWHEKDRRESWYG